MPFHWIEASTGGGEEEWTWFRRELDLPSGVTRVVVRFQSSGVCGLFVNGVFVEAATARYYGRVNAHAVTSRLHAGRNVIGFQTGSDYFFPWAVQRCQTDEAWISQVIAEIEITHGDGRIERVVSDASWRASRNRAESWAGAAEAPVGFVPVRMVHPLIAAEYERIWKRATVWEELDNPYLAGAVNALSKVREDNACVLDFGKTVVGYLDLVFASTPPPSTIATFDYYETPNELKKGAPRGSAVDLLITPVKLPPGGTAWFNLRRRASRYVRIETGDGTPLPEIVRANMLQSALPVETRGAFACSDDTLNQIWDTSRYTLWVNMHQEYESCPRREMLFFSGDGRPDVFSDWYAFGDGRLLDSSLALNVPDQSRFSYGLVRPGENPTPLWDYPAWRIISVLDGFHLTGDAGLLRRNWSDCRDAAAWLLERIDETGLIEQPHVRGEAVYSPLEWTCSFSRIGRKASLNCLLAKALEAMGEMAMILELPAEAKTYRVQAGGVREAINDRLWSDELGAYVDERFDYIPQDGNVLALLFGIAPEDRARRVLDTLKARHWTPWGATLLDRPFGGNTRGGDKTIAPLMCGYEAETRFIAGRGDEALDLIDRCWGTMLRKGAGTFWEFCPNDPVAAWPWPCHGWSSGPAYLLPAFVLGIQNTAPGFAEFVVNPHLGRLTWAKGVVPTPRGGIEVAWRIEESKPRRWICEITVPRGLTGKVVAPSGFRGARKPLKPGHQEIEYRQ